MKYLKYHKEYKLDNIYDDFKSSSLLEEYGLENDITWGGSLLGRLINSTLRKMKIGYNYTKINNLVKLFKQELYSLVEDYSLNDEEKKKLNNLSYRMLLEEIYKEVSNEKDVNDKLKVLLGDASTIGLIDNVITQVEKAELENKETLIEKLKKFKNDLLEIQKGVGENEGENEEGETEENTGNDKSNPALVFYNNSKLLLQSICKIHRDIKNNTVKFEKGVSDEIKIGNEYSYTNKEGKTNRVKVISLNNVINIGNDKEYLTKDDVKKEPIKKGLVSVAIMGPDGKYTASTVAVDPSMLKKTADSKTSTFFDDKKYQQQRTNTVQEVNDKIELAKKGLSVYTAKGNKERINFYNNEINTYQSKLNRLKSREATKTSGKVSTETRPDYDLTADKRAKEETKKMHGHPITVESFINEELDANLRDQESQARSSWNKVVNAYNKSGISKFIAHIESIIDVNGADKLKESKKKILEIGRQVVINYENVGRPISVDELISESEGYSISDIAKSISLFGRVLLAFSEDMGLLGSFGNSYKSEGGDAGGAGNHIKLFITSFDKMKESYPLLKKESMLRNYSSFLLIKEEVDETPDNVSLDEPDNTPTTEEKPTEQPEQQPEEQQNTEGVNEGDSVKKSWFKFFKKGEEKEWKVTEEDQQLREDIEKKEGIDIKLSNPDDDHIIKIVNIFGRAYKLYATDYIPSGRPNGKISLKTMREYEHIGQGESKWSADGSPGFGPWAAKLPYNKWQDGITKILEDKQLRKILANAKFVSDAEASTNTQMKAPGSGKTLFTFINDLLNNDNGTFKKHRAIIFKKYFNTEGSNGTAQQGNLPDSPGLDPIISKDDEGAVDMPFFSEQFTTGLKNKKGNIIKVISKDDNIYTIYPITTGSDKEPYVLFRYQVSSKNNPKQSIASDYVRKQTAKTENKETYKTDYIEDVKNNGIPYSNDVKINIGFASIKGFLIGNKFSFKSISVEDIKNNNFNSIKDYTMVISDIYYLIVPTPEKNRKNGDVKQKNKLVDAKFVMTKNDVDLDGKVNKIIAEFKNKK